MRLLIRSLILVFAMMFVVTGCKSDTPEAPAAETEVVVTEAPQESAQEASQGAAPVVQNAPQPTRILSVGAPLVVTPTETPEPTATPEPPTRTPEPTPEATATPMPTRTPYVAAAPSVSLPRAPKVILNPAVELLEDADPAPPISIHVNANYALDDYSYLVGGVIRNDSAETYVGLGVVGTFYTDKGRRYGPIYAEVPCLFLMPGESCPFVMKALSMSLVSVRMHPNGRPTDRTPVEMAVSGARSYVDAIGYVHLTGSVVNGNAFPVKNPVIAGALVDSNSGIVGVGNTSVVGILEPNTSATFDILIDSAPYVTFRLFAYAEPK